jgi:hypothetical protein
MTDRFRHQLEDYRVVSFIEGKEVQLGGAGPASLSHVSLQFCLFDTRFLYASFNTR